jgi:thiol-disulfide isomerase/thioredoxin
MKTLVSFLILLSSSTLLVAQSFNKEILLKNDQKILVGKIDKTGLNLPSYRSWFQKNYDDYYLDENSISIFAKKLSDYHIKLFMGTWCGDSQREVPRFLKILEHAKFPMEKLQMVAVDVRKDHYKKSPTGEEWGLQILRVPTIIFYKNGREANRIIETPNKTLEEDILDIINGNSYVPNKAKSLHFD